ncbi:MAG: hypothetical protein U0452_16455 [Anaerolineae bacterium]
MTPFRSALTALAGLRPAGVTACFAVEDAPDQLSRGQLPALLVRLFDEQDRRFFRERGEAFEALAFAHGPALVTYAVSHLLLVAPEESGLGARSHLPRLADLLDAYFAALAEDPTLGGALVAPARVTVETGTFTYGDVRCTGAALRHRWQIAY